MAFLIIFGMTAFICYLWVNAIVQMKKDHPDYDGDDFLN